MADLVVVTGGLDTLVARMTERSGDMRPVWSQVSAYSASKTKERFAALGHGGDYDGVHWDPVKDQYTRKTDGVTVPAWGGVPRIRYGISTRDASGRRKTRDVVKQSLAMDRATRRTVLSRYLPGREIGIGPGGTLVEGRVLGSMLTKETNVRGKLRPSGTRWTTQSLLLQDTGKLLASCVQNRRITMHEIRIYAGQDYAAEQHARRPILWWTEEDADRIAEMVAAFLTGESVIGDAEAGSALEMFREPA